MTLPYGRALMFRVGQKVVCIRGPLAFSHAKNVPVIGETYTVRENYLSSIRKEPAILVEELRNDIFPQSGTERGFYACRFRPIITRSTESGMSILRKIADDVTRKGKVDA